MKFTFRWYGEKDPVTLDKIRQIPVLNGGIVSAIDDILPGEVWPMEKINEMKAQIQANGLKFEVIESVAVHEDIKLGVSTRDKYIDNYIETMRRLSKAGIKVICYNFMPVFDWMRSNLNKRNKDGSTSLAYDDSIVKNLNPLSLSDDLNLPAWDKSIGKERMKELLLIYKEFTEEKFFANLKYFLDRIIPVAEEVDIKMAIHPDDPPWSLYGLPRIIGRKENLKKFLALNESVYNGITLCTGSFGCSSENSIEELIDIAKGRIHFAHMRNVLITGTREFQETAHPSACGSLDMYKIMKKLYDSGFDSYVRPDHGRQIWGETKNRAGYGLYDRALGVMYLAGIAEAIEKGVR